MLALQVSSTLSFRPLGGSCGADTSAEIQAKLACVQISTDRCRKTSNPGKASQTFGLLLQGITSGLPCLGVDGFNNAGAAFCHAVQKALAYAGESLNNPGLHAHHPAASPVAWCHF